MLPLLAAVEAGAALIKYVPSLYKLFGDTPPPAAVTRVVEIAQVVTGEAKPEVAIAKLEADPEMMAKYKDAAEARALDMAKAYLADVQDARARDAVLISKNGVNHRANFLTGAAIVAVILCLVVVTWVASLDDYAKATITLICGRALGWVEQIFSFEFGTTKASKTKDDTINKLATTEEIK